MPSTHRAVDYTRSRQLIEHILALISGNGWMADIAYKLGWQANLLIDDCRLTLPAPTAALPPLRIAFAADFHAGPTTHPQAISAACRALHDLQPDLLLLGGDFVSLHARYIEPLAEALGHIPAPLGRYAVLGNHDLWADDAPIVRHLEQANIQVLINQNQQLPPPYDHIWVCGLDDPTSGTPAAPAMFAGVSGERIVIMHSPEGLPFIATQPFALALCGHTHGGQICLPNGRPLWLPHGKWNRQYASGHFQIGAQQHELIVSRGVGYGGLPIRLFAPPDIVLCTVTWSDQYA